MGLVSCWPPAPQGPAIPVVVVRASGQIGRQRTGTAANCNIPQGNRWLSVKLGLFRRRQSDRLSAQPPDMAQMHIKQFMVRRSKPAGSRWCKSIAMKE
jgi:hypothetical protein